MDTDLKTLWKRERKRREALWTLERLRPGAEEAKPLLALLDDIDRQDRENPSGDAGSMSIDELREHVPESPFTGSDGYPFVLVFDQHIPQPWCTRFEAASALSERLSEGSYASDWRRFLRGWVREMEHLALHRERLKND
ncbi:hypothetical protein PS943_04374 [Pseudomonas fluorescens]|uniref:Uncharacterized protein n=1 Tax=Pseudomonas fluorescens TaxID=294 RepID=A0A5E7WMH5_PSEFL|nr:hypothetical protein [Pseudomonas fluorescens]VVQ35495.1 hypothetical protein PS943_04374 [Pseudomonas fluorescens]